DRDDLVADLEGVGVAPLDGCQRGGVVDLDDGEVDDRVEADEGRREDATVGGRDLDEPVGRGPLEGDDVRIGEHVPLLVEDDTRAGAARAARGDVDRDDGVGRLRGDRGDDVGAVGVGDGDRLVRPAV